VVAVDGGTPRLLDVLRKANIDQVDALVATSKAADVASAGRLYQPGLVLLSDTRSGPYQVGQVRIDVSAFGDTIDITVSPAERAPP
jgi:hypothetical protein